MQVCKKARIHNGQYTFMKVDHVLVMSYPLWSHSTFPIGSDIIYLS